MKFDCGETWHEKVKRLQTPHKFFCLWPRRVAEHDCRWLEYIEREGWYYYGWHWYYRPLNDQTCNKESKGE